MNCMLPRLIERIAKKKKNGGVSKINEDFNLV